MARFNINVKGSTRTVDVESDTPLLYVLRDDLSLKGPKFGCGLAQCGACTVHVNGEAVRSCAVPIDQIKGAVTTLEGLGSSAKPSKIQQAFIDEQAVQCGFCLSGVILSAKALLDRNPRATDAELQQSLSGVLCRCFTHTRMMRAIKRYQRSREVRS